MKIDLKNITQGMTGQEAAEVILTNDRKVTGRIGIPWAAVTSGTVNIDWDNSVLRASGQVIVQYEDITYDNNLNQNYTVDYDFTGSAVGGEYQGLQAVFYDKSEKKFIFCKYTAFSSRVNENCYLIALFQSKVLTATLSRIQVNGNWISLQDLQNAIKNIHSYVDYGGNYLPAAEANIKAADIFLTNTNAVYSNVQDENGLNWYRLGFKSTAVNNNTGFLGKNVTNLLKLNSYVTSDLNDNCGFHPGDTLYFKIRYKGNKSIGVILQYNNLSNGNYLARATSDSSTSNTTETETIIYAAKTLNALPANYEKVGLSLCFQTNGQELDSYVEFREATVSKTPFNNTDLIVADPFDYEFYNEEDGTQTRESVNASNSLVGNANYQQPTAEINHAIIYGQSLSTGQQTAPAISLTNFKGNIMIGLQEWINDGNTNLDQFNLLYARPAIATGYTQEQTEALPITDQARCESPNMGFANAIKAAIDRHVLEMVDRKILATSCGSGGQSIELLSKNNPNNGGSIYRNQFLAALTRAKQNADALSKSLVCTSVIWQQGEYNYIAQPGQGWTSGTPATNDKDQYATYFDQLVTDMIADIIAAYGQSLNPIILTYQPGTAYIRSDDMPIGMALLESSNKDSRVLLASPQYSVTSRGGGHYDPNGARWIGEQFAKVYNTVVLRGEKWSPLQPKKITKNLNNIIIDFHVPVPPLRWDTKTVKPINNYGFYVTNNGAAVGVSSVELIGATSVKISTAVNLTGDVTISYASLNYRYGNLCDSDTYKALTNYVELPEQLKPTNLSGGWEPKDEKGNIIYNKPYPLQNFCVQFWYKLLAANNILEIKIL